MLGLELIRKITADFFGGANNVFCNILMIRSVTHLIRLSYFGERKTSILFYFFLYFFRLKEIKKDKKLSKIKWQGNNSKENGYKTL